MMRTLSLTPTLALTLFFFLSPPCAPQDKVGDFSGFSPDRLLLETEKALSPHQLYDPHLQLINLQDSVRAMMTASPVLPFNVLSQ